MRRGTPTLLAEGKMKIRRAALATLLTLLASSPLDCTGFSARRSDLRRGKCKGKGGRFSDDIVEDAVVRDVTAKVRRDKSSIIKEKSLNARQKSFSQRDPIISLNMNLDYLGKSGQKDAAHRCEEMLLRIEALHDKGYYDKSPDVVSYNSVINAYAHGGASKYPRSEHAKRLMKRMQEKGLEPNSITWNILLRCLSREVGEKRWQEASGKKVEEAESILANMEEKGLASTISYNTVISIISKSKLNGSASRAESWLKRMTELYETTQNDKIQPDTTSFNSVIHAYANVSMKSRGAHKRARQAEKLVKQMEKLYTSGENDKVKPDVVSYSAVVNAHARAASQDERCAERAITILDRMLELHEGGDKEVKPNKRTYTSVINAFARIGKAEKADEILSKMKKLYEMGDASLKPDTICYSSVLDGYARKGGEEAALRAEELLREMQNMHNKGDNDVRPNTRTYRAVITVLGRSKQPRAAEKAEQILQEMERTSSQGDASDYAPNTIVYNALIDAFARSKTVSKAYRAELLLERMLEESEKGNSSMRPDTITFNSVINAAARSVYGDSVVRHEAYLIGLNAFKTLHRLHYCKPSSITYVTFLKLLDNLVASGSSRDYMAEKVFALSSSMGLANGLVKSQLRKTCSPLVTQRILSSCDVEGGTEESGSLWELKLD